MLLLGGLASIAIGVLTFVWPSITALALLKIATAIRLRREIRNEWLLALSGALSVVFAILVALFPGVGALAITWLIGAYALIFGALLLVLAWRLRKIQMEFDASIRGMGRAAA